MPFPYRPSYCALLIGAATLSMSVTAETSFRQHDAHVHGVVEFNIAQDGHDLLMEITAPGADIVGFEHAPENNKQRQALENAIQQLKRANTLFSLTEAASCKLTDAHITETLTAHNDHDHAHHDCDGHEHHDKHDHDKHEHHEHHDKHDHDKHEHHEHHDKHAHDKHEHHEHHDEHAHDKHEHNEHHDEHDHGGHGEFSAQYTFHCDNIEQLKALQVNWFKSFPNTETITVQTITATGQKAGELTTTNTLFKF